MTRAFAAPAAAGLALIALFAGGPQAAAQQSTAPGSAAACAIEVAPGAHGGVVVRFPTGGPGGFAATGPNRALCCGPVDAGAGTGTNCALLPPLSECHGKILACPDGEVLNTDGSGACA